MRIRSLKENYSLPTNLSFAAMNQGLFLEFIEHTTPGTANNLYLSTVETYQGVPIYVKNNASSSILLIHADQSDTAETIEGAAAIYLYPGEYTILRGVINLDANVNYFTSEKSTVGDRPYKCLTILPAASGDGITEYHENSTGETFDLTTGGTGLYTLTCTTDATFFNNKHCAVYVAGRRHAVVTGGNPDNITLSVYDPSDTLAAWGSGSTVVSQVEFRFYPES